MTKLLYMNDFDVTECDAKVVGLGEFDGKQVVVLDQTCFYPKGGGQDFDQGIITSQTAAFEVEAVFFVDGEVKHIGQYSHGELHVDDSVHCEVLVERRLINTKIHSAGHVLDMAVRKLNWNWKPGKGAHYPHMAFVEYSGEFDSEQKQKTIDELQAKIDELVANGSINSIQFMTPEEMANTGAIVPENLPKGKPTRVMFYDNFAVPCGGTHVRNIQDVGKVTVTNIKRRDGGIRVSYSVA